MDGGLTVSTATAAETLSTEKEEVAAEVAARRKHPHGARRKEILSRHPEIAERFGTEPLSAVATLAVVSLQFAASYFVSKSPLWVVFVVAYCFGAVLDHALFVMIHDAGHNLFFRSVFWNRVWLLVANLPQIIPSAVLFRFYHIQHHIELNRPMRDPDVPMEWEANWVGNSAFRKAFWLANFAIFQGVRMLFYTHKVPLGKELVWVAANWITCVAAGGVMYQLCGLKCVFYLVISTLFSVGLHPLGARWIAEHYPNQPFQSTYSYYGKGNRVAFNIGFHNEHHDFPSIPWNRLPELRKLAPEYYDTLYSYPSYTKLLLDFIFNPEWDLSSRIEADRKHS